MINYFKLGQNNKLNLILIFKNIELQSHKTVSKIFTPLIF